MSTKPYDFADAAFYFFRIFKEKPFGLLSIAFWQTLLYAAVLIPTFMFLAPLYGELFSSLMSGQEPDEEVVLSRVVGIMALVPVMSIGALLAALLAQGAWLRLSVRQEIASVIPFRFGGDELRLLVVNILIGMIFLALYMLFFVPMMMSAGAAAFNEGAAVGGMLFSFLLFPFILIGMAILGVRISASPATTMLDKQIRFPAFAATRGIFWNVLGAYIIVMLIIWFASTVIQSFAMFAVFGSFMPSFIEFADAAETMSDREVEETIRQAIQGIFEPGVMSLVGVGLVIAVFFQSLIEGWWHSIGAYTARWNAGLETEVHPAFESTQGEASSDEPAGDTDADTETVDDAGDAGDTTGSE